MEPNEQDIEKDDLIFFNEKSGTMAQYLTEREMLEVIIRLDEHVQDLFTVIEIQ